MDIRILEVELEVAEAYGITNGSSQGMEPQDDPLVLDRCFPARLTSLKGRKMPSTYPPHLSSDGKRGTKYDSLRLASLGAVARLKKLCRVPVLVL
jgi:hypothetical protein